MNVPFPGDNGELKPRFCVVLERVPAGVPKFLLLVACCSETKPGSIPTRFVRVDHPDAIDDMGLDHASTFHIEDIRAYDIRSPMLDRKKGRCQPEELLELKRLKEIFFEGGDALRLVLLPPNASPEAQAAVTQFVAIARTKTDSGSGPR